MFEHECPKCGGPLYLWKATVAFQGLRIQPDGFAFADANHGETTNEVVICGDCRWEGPLVFRLSDDAVSSGPHYVRGQRRSDWS